MTPHRNPPSIVRLASDYQLPDYYDLRTAHLVADIDFYAAVAADSGIRILEIGCGTGRILQGLAKRGFQNLAGIDRSTTMLEAARAKLGQTGPEFHQVDAGRDLGRRWLGRLGSFRLIVVGFNTFHEIGPLARRLACLRNCERLLDRDGHVVIDSRIPPFFRAGTRNIRDKLVGTFVDRQGNVVEHFLDLKADFVMQMLSGTGRYRVYDREGQIREYQAPVRSWLAKPDEVLLLAEVCGLRCLARWGGYDQSAFTNRSERQLVVLGKAGTP